MDIKPIETIYNDYRFRSRLEARWAVFMDVLGVKYEYEREGFELPGVGRYLPDFYLPNFANSGQDCWLEIKPENRAWPGFGFVGVWERPNIRCAARVFDFSPKTECDHAAEGYGTDILFVWLQRADLSLQTYLLETAQYIGANKSTELPRIVAGYNPDEMQFTSQAEEFGATEFWRNLGQVTPCQSLVELIRPFAPPFNDAEAKCEALHQASKQTVFLLAGQPKFGAYTSWHFDDISPSDSGLFMGWGTYTHDKVKRACEIATQARFEFGQTPKI